MRPDTGILRRKKKITVRDLNPTQTSIHLNDPGNTKNIRCNRRPENNGRYTHSLTINPFIRCYSAGEKTRFFIIYQFDDQIVSLKCNTFAKTVLILTFIPSRPSAFSITLVVGEVLNYPNRANRPVARGPASLIARAPSIIGSKREC